MVPIVLINFWAFLALIVAFLATMSAASCSLSSSALILGNCLSFLPASADSAINEASVIGAGSGTLLGGGGRLSSGLGNVNVGLAKGALGPLALSALLPPFESLLLLLLRLRLAAAVREPGAVLASDAAKEGLDDVDHVEDIDDVDGVDGVDDEGENEGLGKDGRDEEDDDGDGLGKDGRLVVVVAEVGSRASASESNTALVALFCFNRSAIPPLFVAPAGVVNTNFFRGPLVLLATRPVEATSFVFSSNEANRPASSTWRSSSLAFLTLC